MPDAPPGHRRVVAAFDVDRTLTTRDCVTPFLRRAAGMRLVLALLRRPLTVLAAVRRRDRDLLKEVACSALRGRDAAELDRLGARFAAEVASGWLREDTVERLQRHRELGHTVILASASLDAYLLPLGERLGVDAVVCTRLERDPNGRLTGRLAGANCRSVEKARRVRAWLDGAGMADAVLWAYGDSSDDSPLLELAAHPVWVGDALLEDDPSLISHLP